MVAIPWKFESSYPHQFWGCSSVDRALRSHRRGRGFESHQLHQIYLSALPIRKFECLGGACTDGRKELKLEQTYSMPRIAALLKSLRGYGGMVDAEDLKSFGHCDRVGSSPTIPTTHSPNKWRFFIWMCSSVG